MAAARLELDERFDGDALDLDVWFPHYLPHWSSRAESAATWAVEDGSLCLSIPADQPLWCADQHQEPLRVSCVQTGNWSGPVGGAAGQQPFRDGLVVREEQPAMWGYTPTYGRIEVRMRATITERSMFAFWMSGIEDQPERSGEICVAEVFGDALDDGHAMVGMGVHRFRDPHLTEQFVTVPLALDVAELHTYGVDWHVGALEFSVDGLIVHRLDQAPDYPMQLMIGVFDFPVRGADGADVPLPELVVTEVRGRPLV